LRKTKKKLINELLKQDLFNYESLKQSAMELTISEKIDRGKKLYKQDFIGACTSKTLCDLVLCLDHNCFDIEGLYAAIKCKNWNAYDMLVKKNVWSLDDIMGYYPIHFAKVTQGIFLHKTYQQKIEEIRVINNLLSQHYDFNPRTHGRIMLNTAFKYNMLEIFRELYEIHDIRSSLTMQDMKQMIRDTRDGEFLEFFLPIVPSCIDEILETVALLDMSLGFNAKLVGVTDLNENTMYLNEKLADKFCAMINSA
jgi:hypothetical protein